MAKITNVDTNQEFSIPDGGEIRGACTNAGVLFGCEDGNCGVCQIEVIEGEDNLEELNEKEKSLGMDSKHRLACQSKIKEGELKFRY